jgi:hypothetical protein
MPRARADEHDRMGRWTVFLGQLNVRSLVSGSSVFSRRRSAVLQTIFPTVLVAADLDALVAEVEPAELDLFACVNGWPLAV